jgi:hypothetical protein
VQDFDILQDVFYVSGNRIREDGESLVVAFAISDNDLMLVKVNIFDAQAHTFHDANSAAIEDFCHQSRQSMHKIDNGHGFSVGKYCGQAFRAGWIDKFGW